MYKKFLALSFTFILASSIALPVSFASPLNSTSQAKLDVAKLADLAEFAVIASSRGNTSVISEPPVNITNQIENHSVLNAPASSAYPVISSASVYINTGSLSFCVSEKDASGKVWRIDTSNQVLALAKMCTSKDALTNRNRTFHAKALALYDSVVFADEDAISIGQEITAILSDYTSLGTKSGSITISGKHFIKFAPMIKATGAPQSTAVTTGPGLTVAAVRLSTGSTLTSANYGAGSAVPWCLVIKNGLAYAQFTNNVVAGGNTNGGALNSVFGPAPKCINGQGQ